jgi:hypothetical protein
MYLEDILAGLSGALRGGLQGYSFMKELEQDKLNRTERANREFREFAERDAERTHRATRERIGDERYEDTRRRDNAGILASLLEPNQALTDDQFGQLEGTPLEARVRSVGTLPSRTVPETGIDLADPGGAMTHTWMPNREQAAAAKMRTDREAYVASLPLQARRVAQARALDLPLTGRDLTTPEEEARVKAQERETEFADWQRRERFQDSLIRGRTRDRGPEPDVDPYYQRDKGEYEMFLSTYNKEQDSRREQDDITGKEKKAPYVKPPSFEEWRAAQKNRGPLARRGALPIEPMRPMPSHGAAPQPVSSHGGPPAANVPQVGQVVSVRGRRVRVTKVNPDGSLEGVPVG